MENTNNAPEEQEPVDRQEGDGPKFKKQRVMPSLEGINAPKSTQDVVFIKPKLTKQEKELITGGGPSPKTEKQPEPKLLPNSVIKRVNKKPSSVKGLVITFIILVVLIFGAYELYLWYFVGNSSTPAGTSAFINNGPGNGAGQIPNDSGQSSSTITSATSSSASLSGISSSSPFDLAGGSIASSAAANASSTVPAAASTTPATQLTVNSTPTGYLNVRSSPSSSGTLITQVHPGETYPYTAAKSGWYNITLPSGQTGWVSGQYVTAK